MDPKKLLTPYNVSKELIEQFLRHPELASYNVVLPSRISSAWRN